MLNSAVSSFIIIIHYHFYNLFLTVWAWDDRGGGEVGVAVLKPCNKACLLKPGNRACL